MVVGRASSARTRRPYLTVNGAPIHRPPVKPVRRGPRVWHAAHPRMHAAPLHGIPSGLLRVLFYLAEAGARVSYFVFLARVPRSVLRFRGPHPEITGPSELISLWMLLYRVVGIVVNRRDPLQPSSPVPREFTAVEFVRCSLATRSVWNSKSSIPRFIFNLPRSVADFSRSNRVFFWGEWGN